MISSNAVKLKWVDSIQDYIIDVNEEQEACQSFEYSFMNIDTTSEIVVLKDLRYEPFENFFEEFDSDIYSTDMRQKDVNNFYKLSEKLITNFHQLLVNLATDGLRDEINKTATIAKEYVIKKIRAKNSALKRKSIV